MKQYSRWRMPSKERHLESPVLATWVIRSENRHYENGILSLNRLQTKSGEGKIGSRHSILMHERRTSHVKGKRIL